MKVANAWAMTVRTTVDLFTLLNLPCSEKNGDTTCLTFDSGLTDRIYSSDGTLTGSDGSGEAYGVKGFYNPMTNRCSIQFYNAIRHRRSPRETRHDIKELTL